MFKNWIDDVKSIRKRDPSTKSLLEIILLYPGSYAIFFHRMSHFLYRKRLFFFARLISQVVRFFTGIEIHPGAKLGRGLFIDHGMGVVIGETSEIGDNCTIYHGVTLGGTGKDVGKRHPTVGNNVLISAGAKILGPIIIGDNTRIGANAVVLSDTEENTTVVGVPARPTHKTQTKTIQSFELDQIHIPDPVSQELCKLISRVEKMEATMLQVKLSPNEKLQE